MEQIKLFSIEFYNYPIMVDVVRDSIDTFAKDLDMDNDERKAFLQVSIVILEQRMRKAYSQKGKFYLRIYYSNKEIMLSLRDMGTPYFTSNTINFSDENKIIFNKLKENKMVYMFDEETQQNIPRATFNRLGRNGQVINIRGKLLKELELPQYEEEEEIVTLDTNFKLLELGENDIEINEAVSCIYEEYKYTYGYEELYIVNSIKRLIKEGVLNSYLVVNDHKQVAGHFALTNKETLPKMPEVSTVIVKKGFRGIHLGEKIFEYAVEQAKLKNMSAIWTQPTAFHVGTQTICNRLGFVAVGFLFQYINDDVKSEYNKNPRRLDLTMSVKLLKPMEFKIYCPHIIKNFAKNIFQQLNSPVEFLREKHLYEESEMTIQINDRISVAKVVFDKVGIDLPERLAEIRLARRKNNLAMIEVLISMQNYSIIYAFEYLKKEGFIFSGIIPGSDKGVYCVMQNLCDLTPEYDLIVTIEPYTTVLEEIKEIDDSFMDEARIKI